MADSYSSPRWASVQHQIPLSGNDHTTLLLTPQAGTGAETKTHTTTLKPEHFATAVKIKTLIYSVNTAYTGTGCSLALDLYVGTTSKGSLSVTSEAAGALATSSAINAEVAAGGYIQLIAKSLTTASTANSAIGKPSVVYEESFTNV